jgi:hypothetical protein
LGKVKLEAIKIQYREDILIESSLGDLLKSWKREW